MGVRRNKKKKVEKKDEENKRIEGRDERENESMWNKKDKL